MRAKIAILIAPFLLLGPAMPAQAQTAKLYAYNFLVEVGCSQIEEMFPYACTLLNPETAVGIIKLRQDLLINKNCGTGSIEGAKQMVAIDPDDNQYQRCREVLKGIGAIK